jgi:hypothetical protein
MKTKAARHPTPKTRNRKADDLEQFKRFVEAPRKAGVDESPGALDQAFRRVAPLYCHPQLREFLIKPLVRPKFADREFNLPRGQDSHLYHWHPTTQSREGGLTGRGRRARNCSPYRHGLFAELMVLQQRVCSEPPIVI